MANYYILAGAVLLFMATSVFIIWKGSWKKKDKYDFDSLSRRPVFSGSANQRDDFMEKLGRSLGINNFHELSDHFEALVRDGKKPEAIDYLTANTPLDKNVALRLVKLFEARLRKA